MGGKRILKWTEISMLVAGTPISTGKSYSILYYIWAYFSQASFIFFCISLSLGATSVTEDKEKLDRNEEFLLLSLLLLWKLAISRSSRFRSILKEVGKVEAQIFLGDNEIVQIYQENTRHNYKIFFYLSCIYSSSTLGYFYMSIKQWILMRNWNAEEKFLLIAGWFPVDLTKHFNLAYFHQISVVFNLTLYSLALDSLIISLVNFAAVRLVILGYKFEHLGSDVGSRTQPVYDSLRDIVMEHKRVIRYVENLNLSLKWYFFGDFVSRSYHLSLTIMNVIRHRSQAIIFYEIFTVMFMLSQSTCFYYHANRLIIESTDLSMKIFHSCWYDQTYIVKKSLMITMARAQKPLALTIGNFRQLDNNLLVQIVKAGYTFFLYQILDILH